MVPHLHHTLTLNGNSLDFKLGPTCELYGLALTHIVKEIRVEQSWGLGASFTPPIFSQSDLRYFSAFSNVYTLKLQNLEIYRFIQDIQRYFGHFSPTLRSMTLLNPNCTPQQLSHFLSSFQNLDDIEIEGGRTHIPNETTPDTELVPLSAPKLQGRLVLRDFRWVETWTHLVTSCGGLRFHHVDLRKSASCVPTLLEACADTLETVRLNPTVKVDLCRHSAPSCVVPFVGSS